MAIFENTLYPNKRGNKRRPHRPWFIAVLALVSCSQQPIDHLTTFVQDDLFGANQCYLVENRLDTFSEATYFQLLEGEYFGKHDLPLIALEHYSLAATESQDIFILSRATDIARYLEQHTTVIALSHQWMKAEPLCPQPYELAMEAHLLDREVEQAMDVFSNAVAQGVRINIGYGLYYRRNLSEPETQRFVAKLSELDQLHPEALKKSIAVTEAQNKVLDLRPKGERDVYKIRRHQIELIDYPVAEIKQLYDILTHIDERALDRRPQAYYVKAAIAAMYIDQDQAIPEEYVLFDDHAPHDVYNHYLASTIATLMISHPNTPLRSILASGTQGMISVTDQRSTAKSKQIVSPTRREIESLQPDEVITTLKNGSVCVTINHFTNDSANRISRAIRNLVPTKDDGVVVINRLIIDLRGSKGGTLTAAVEISDLFLDKNLIVLETRGRHEDTNEIFSTVNAPSFRTAGVTILVDEFTAGSAEIMAHALRYYLNARLVGSTTYGLHTVRTLFPLRSGDSISLTTAEYIGPGEQRFDRGLQPDHCYVPPGSSGASRSCDRQDLKVIPVDTLLEQARQSI